MPLNKLYLIHKYPKLTCTILGMLAALSMAPTYLWPLLMLAVCGVVLIMAKIDKPGRGGFCIFFFGMGFFTVGLYWVSNALFIKIEDYWWIMGFSILGLPFLLSLLWFVAGWVTIKLTKNDTLARAVLLLTLLSLAEYGRAFNLTGFPWNLFAYTWGDAIALAQVNALGGAYFLNTLTIFWMATPALLTLLWPQKKIAYGIASIALLSFIACETYGFMRLNAHPTVLRTDAAVVVVQPDIDVNDKWEADQAVEHFMTHVNLSTEGLNSIEINPDLKSVMVLWPETSLDEALVLNVPEVPKALIKMMDTKDFKTYLVTGIWRQQFLEGQRKPDYYNSVAAISMDNQLLNLDDIYDKHHLVPFGEFLPMEQTLGITPLVGFAGFKWGDGPKTISSPGMPKTAPMICFEAVFPWYGHNDGAEWLANTSNDGWYGDTPGPYQHLAMSRFRAIEQGIPLVRAATTGISAVSDSYGRLLASRPYETAGQITYYLPEKAENSTLYTRIGELLFFLLLGGGFLTSAALRYKMI